MPPTLPCCRLKPWLQSEACEGKQTDMDCSPPVQGAEHSLPSPAIAQQVPKDPKFTSKMPICLKNANSPHRLCFKRELPTSDTQCSIS
jgi:hypothetical protein